MNKRASGPPRRPRNPVAKAVRTPAFKQRVVPDKRWKTKLEDVEKTARETPPEDEKPEV
ncbi:MAG: hypothetical protein MUE86_01270 [Thiobacillaceae bacterium]|jgi:hypothetical protein|nr:MAG: hypothetical protein FD142_2561 [bacterium]KAF0148179.1 MAG: hypothetical protein FD187_2186 [bacterium]KAF0167694.1 MAG: hypothetical protein FD158_2066 [bacterium]MCU0933083.1 hypothetical protein [Thiobacillaceae bacterium]TXT21097.1 MAG: hypothetical protein FD132_816 [bacterium]